MTKIYVPLKSIFFKAIFYSFFLIVATCTTLHAQDQSPDRRIIEGVLRDNTGEPLPGVSIYIKGTSKGTITDVNGYYSIEASLDDILVYAYIGFTTREVRISENNSQSVKKPKEKLARNDCLNNKAIISINSDSGKHVAFMDQDPKFFTIKYQNFYTDQFHGLPGEEEQVYRPLPQSIKSIKSLRTGTYEILEKKTGYYKQKVKYQYSTGFSISSVYRLPDLQIQYAQGRPVNGELSWRGPESGELFSWGPPVKQLEFNGLTYPWDKNGQLVPAGSGNGTPANVYDPYDVLDKSGHGFSNFFRISMPFLPRTSIEIEADHRLKSSYIPNSGSKRIRSGVKLNYDNDDLDITTNLHFGNNRDDLPLSSNNALILASIMNTPVSFDNSNGLRPKDAVKNPESYLFENGTQRAYALNNSDNPYWLMNTIPDVNKRSYFLTGIKIKATPGDYFTLNMQTDYHETKNDRVIGFAPQFSGYPSGRESSRNMINKLLTSNLSLSYEKNWHFMKIRSKVKYHATFEDVMLHRTDNPDLSGSDNLRSLTNYTFERLSHEPGIETNLEIGVNYDRPLILNLALDSYCSNTLDKPIQLLPSVGAAFRISEFIYGDFLSNFKIRGEFSKFINEAPLVYPSLSFNTLKYDTEDFYRYYESDEILYNPDLLLEPEKHSKYDAGIDLGFFNDRIELEFIMYKNETDHFFCPVLEDNNFLIKNTGLLVTTGEEFIATLINPLYGDFNFDCKLIFHSSRSIVKKLNSSAPYIPISGFSDVFGVAKANTPLGTIYGTRFLRNEEQQLIIDEDGYPIADQTMYELADPNPDWTGGFETTFYYKQFTLSFLIEASHGGKIWNGTKSVLNYFGKSAETGRLRNTSNYIFEGVTQEGLPNNTYVNFADPDLPVEENRWVRYGFTGVTEEAIEDASWLKLSEINLKYSLRDLFQRALNIPLDGDITVYSKNLFLLSKYRGSDPQSTLFNYPVSSGLDLFNAPPVRMYGFSLTLKNF